MSRFFSHDSCLKISVAFSYFYDPACCRLKKYKQYDVKALLALVSQDDADAFTELYNRFWKKLFTIAWNRLREKESAEDIVHDIFAALWLNRATLAIDNLEHYLAVAVKYAVLSKIKKQLRDEELLQNVSAAPVIDLPVEAALHHKQLLERIRHEVEQLPVRCRLIFKYSRYSGMPVKEIATELNISPKTVENQLTKAIRQLRVATRSLLHSLLVFFLIQ
jgi:RNA polymerase sigma-70 factor (family 1)